MFSHFVVVYQQKLIFFSLLLEVKQLFVDLLFGFFLWLTLFVHSLWRFAELPEEWPQEKPELVEYISAQSAKFLCENLIVTKFFDTLQK